jgi:hypothetical protein
MGLSALATSPGMPQAYHWRGLLRTRPLKLWPFPLWTAFPVGRDRARCHTARLSIPPVGTVRATCTAHGSCSGGLTLSFAFR